MAAQQKPPPAPAGNLKRKRDDGNPGSGSQNSKKRTKFKPGIKSNKGPSGTSTPVGAKSSASASPALSKKAMKRAARALVSAQRASNLTPTSASTSASTSKSHSPGPSPTYKTLFPMLPKFIQKPTNSRPTSAGSSRARSPVPKAPTSNPNSPVPAVIDFYNVYRWASKSHPGTSYHPDPDRPSGFASTNCTSKNFLPFQGYVLVLENVSREVKVQDLARTIKPYQM